MTEQVYERELGGIHEQLKTISLAQEEVKSEVGGLRREIRDVDAKVVKLSLVGCARGEQQDLKIDELKKLINTPPGGNGSGKKPVPPPLKKISGRVLGQAFNIENYSSHDLVRLAMVVGIAWLIWSQYDSKRTNAHNEVSRAADVVKTDRAIEKKAVGP